MKPLFNKKCKLEKFHGKGGWTYARLTGLVRKNAEWKKVKGTVEGYEIRKYHLMPMGEGKLFLPLNATIRKQIKKGEGDTVHIILYPDNEPLEVPEEMLWCMQDEPKALAFFNSITESEKMFYIKWIYSAKREETKVDRLAKTIDRLVQGLKLYDKI